MDPYVYEGKDVLINKMNIRNAEKLIDVEAQLFIANVLDIQTIVQQIDFRTHKSLQMIHQHLFEEIYTWAGEYRTVNIYKSEQVLNGLSINYSEKSQIVFDLQKVFARENQVQWNNDNPNLKEDFSRLMIDLWRIHPFKDGNGRTARLLLNLELMKDGYPPVIIKVENRLAYYEALDKTHTTQDYKDFISLVGTEVKDSLDLYLKAIQ